MKNIFLKNAVVTISLLLTAGYTGITSAHTQTGSLGTAAGATDLYLVNCSTDSGGVTHHLSSSVITGVAPAGLKVSVRTQKAAKATNSTDAINGDSVASPAVNNASGDGPYYMSVGKTAANTVAISYTVDFHCENSAGGHTGTAIYLLQNQ